MVCESPRIIENHPKTISDWFVNHWEHQKLPQKRFQSGLRITENCWESPIIAPKQFQTDLLITKNHQESLRITLKQFQSGSWIIKNHRKSLWITENQTKTISDWSPRIIKNCQESMRIAPIMISEWFANHWESPRIPKNYPQNNFTENHWESLRMAWLRITKNWSKNDFRLICKSPRIAKNHIKNKILPLQLSKAKWHRCLKITVFIVILSDSHWFSFILRIILFLPLGQNHRHRPHICPCRQQ